MGEIRSISIKEITPLPKSTIAPVSPAFFAGFARVPPATDASYHRSRGAREP